MALIEEFERTGSWLFRWRSYLPFVFLPLIVTAVLRYPVIELHPNLHFVWSIISLGVSLVGLAVRCHAVGHAADGTSGRNTKTLVAETLSTSGFYSVVRHPLYLGNFLIALGIVLHSAAPWLVVVYLMAFTLYYERIMFTEEAFLRKKFGRVFTDWSNRTPAFVPKLRQWKSAELPLDIPKVIRAESAAVAVIALTFPALELAMHEAQQGNVAIEKSWYILLGSGIHLYIIARVMKRQLRRWLKYERILYEAAK
ncbi:Isoprenylcysteine carboxyl methyltransferase (ICMT) family protein [Rubripirellula lacrimiformis]|uniref:Isoprenylcysteine carboxyl methyltransferase (ICMT) family protein n=1 Tax=Rubripirellula lacrimiformis TaxID=1930273 RepID=A0A517NDE7_9BACT|nr:isoprenylcysteine carboxylmethyltransferase family protein [Rubripirellula lacrimiformis]QDT05149.1 Isoprenylcysteine carboxyl methyltransferase (ICMT) family protein [Rubripirellula lacrimiformis]